MTPQELGDSEVLPECWSSHGLGNIIIDVMIKNVFYFILCPVVYYVTSLKDAWPRGHGRPNSGSEHEQAELKQGELCFTSVVRTWFVYEKSDTEQRSVLC